MQAITLEQNDSNLTLIAGRQGLKDLEGLNTSYSGYRSRLDILLEVLFRDDSLQFLLCNRR